MHLDQKLNIRLQKACGKDFEVVCPDVPGYAMIRCLYRKANNEEEGDQDKAVMNKVCVCLRVCVFLNCPPHLDMRSRTWHGVL